MPVVTDGGLVGRVTAVEPADLAGRSDHPGQIGSRRGGRPDRRIECARRRQRNQQARSAGDEVCAGQRSMSRSGQHRLHDRAGRHLSVGVEGRRDRRVSSQGRRQHRTRYLSARAASSARCRKSAFCSTSRRRKEFEQKLPNAVRTQEIASEWKA